MTTNNIRAVRALKEIEEHISNIFEIEPIEVNNDYNLLYIGDISIWIEVIDFKRRYMINVKEIKLIGEIQNKSIGSFLMGIICKICSELNVTVGLFVTPDNKVALNWYKKLGFKKKDKLKNGHLWLECRELNLEYLKYKF